MDVNPVPVRRGPRTSQAMLVPGGPAERIAILSPREREAVRLVAEGLSNAEITQRLVISPATAKAHVNRALRKCGCRDRAQLVILAYEGGLVKVGGRTG
ncbi:response regulator transcription factor [Kineosporia babensis]|uniref:Helix-turn-helix transcriptional regulator n=1 Tax=Kineosporia babensis TaxID=499548 RepID=A0A9X1SY01_9ACTN|nr:helix-turn-helix transcriptional regulator [Kineosporia babensis]MCD5315775.1 helix-turn-helix transcriptional regulator [Kineosporia babensis]